ncbi:MAG TPA: HlyD family efflux transporter periplasmic adaptor subunit [Bryobacteraceae bacterium]|nr:HlyD family efflux transporter periplasmic adaptor subunit [Bryobacteraceae bacterium]
MTRCICILLSFSAALHAADDAAARTVRITGTIQAVHSTDIRVPLVAGQGANVTLTRLVHNGVTVQAGAILAEFDDTSEVRLARDAHSKYDDLSHQVDEKKAEHVSNAEKRASELAQAEADLKKAEIDIRKGPILSQIEQDKNQVKLEDAQAHVASLQRSGHAHDIAEEAAIRILELQRDRQRVALDRSETNIQKLAIRAPISGMIALENVWRQGSFGHAAEGDQLWPGSPIARLFDPSQMEVDVNISEADRAILLHLQSATVRLDAFPSVILPAHFDSASPVATSNLGVPVKNFAGKFVIDKVDSHLLPDLSAAVDIQVSR